MMIRNDEITKAWELGDVTIVTQKNKLHLIFKETLNISVPIEDIVYHAGSQIELVDAILSLANEDKASVLAGFTAITRAIRRL